jgi:predicted transcriptional regulator
MFPVFLLCLVIVGVIFLACYAAYHFGRKSKIDPIMKARMDKQLNKHRILKTVHKEEETNKIEERTVETVLKIRILEKLNISPDTLKNCIKELVKEELIIEADESVILTTFGITYCEVFVNPKKGNN